MKQTQLLRHHLPPYPSFDLKGHNMLLLIFPPVKSCLLFNYKFQKKMSHFEYYTVNIRAILYIAPVDFKKRKGEKKKGP